MLRLIWVFVVEGVESRSVVMTPVSAEGSRSAFLMRLVYVIAKAMTSGRVQKRRVVCFGLVWMRGNARVKVGMGWVPR